MTKRDRKLEQMAGQAKDEQTQLWIGKITAELDGEFLATVNGRTVARQALASSDFAFASQGRGSIVGENVIVAASELNDLCFIMGASPYIL